MGQETTGRIWRCPRCHDLLHEADADVRCVACGQRYGRVGDILDLRVEGPSWIDRETDRADARRLLDVSGGDRAESLIRHVFSQRPGWDRARVESRARAVAMAPERLRGELQHWLAPALRAEAPLLDLGCGPGMLLAATANTGPASIGVDVSLVWLVVAQRLIREWGGVPVLAAALAEALPLANGVVGGVLSLDVIEHVADRGSYVREIDRVLRPGGFIALSTPNRFSLAAEPHVGVWGVGWLPRRWQRPYAEWRSGNSYASTSLLSARELQWLLATGTQLESRVMAPSIPAADVAQFPAYRRVLARVYNRLLVHARLQRLFLFVGPFFRVVGTKKETPCTIRPIP
jgi:SAM-dependent methyltransferase